MNGAVTVTGDGESKLLGLSEACELTSETTRAVPPPVGSSGQLSQVVRQMYTEQNTGMTLSGALNTAWLRPELVSRVHSFCCVVDK